MVNSGDPELPAFCLRKTESPSVVAPAMTSLLELANKYLLS